MASVLGAAPAFQVSRPALGLLTALVGHSGEVALTDVVEMTSKPRSTVQRWLGELVGASLVMRASRDLYTVPSRATQTLLLAEPSAYARSLLLQHDILSRNRLRHAFACLPVRHELPYNLAHAVPVLNLSDKRVKGLPPAAFPEAFRAVFDSADEESMVLHFPRDAAAAPDAIARKFPSLAARKALALFAACGDPRLVQAALTAATRLGLADQAVAADASQLVVEASGGGARYPNAVVLPRWLEKSYRGASRIHTQRYLARDARAPTDVAGEDP